jgi:hypothetical protein
MPEQISFTNMSDQHTPASPVAPGPSEQPVVDTSDTPAISDHPDEEPLVKGSENSTNGQQSAVDTQDNALIAAETAEPDVTVGIAEITPTSANISGQPSAVEL